MPLTIFGLDKNIRHGCAQLRCGDRHSSRLILQVATPRVTPVKTTALHYYMHAHPCCYNSCSRVLPPLIILIWPLLPPSWDVETGRAVGWYCRSQPCGPLLLCSCYAPAMTPACTVHNCLDRPLLHFCRVLPWHHATIAIRITYMIPATSVCNATY